MPSEEPQLNIAQLLSQINVEPVKKAPREADLQTRVESRDLDYERKLAVLENLKDHFIQRKKYARLILILACGWVIAVFVMLLLQGFTWWGFHLSDSIILAALGTTTANIFGVLLIVTKYFFPSDSTKPPDSH
jgi:uncharacterized membrane protein YjjP (DUF1212 family)